MIPLSPGPVPSTSSELQDRITDGVRRALGASSTDGILVGASIESPEVLPLVAITLTHVTAGSLPSFPSSAAPSSSAAILGEVRIAAEALRLRGIPVDITASAEHIPVSWRTGTDGLWLVPDEAAGTASGSVGPASTEGAAVSGDLLMSVPVAALETAVRAEVARQVEGHGLSLKEFTLGIDQTAPNTLALTSVATVGKAFLKATVTVTGRARIDDELALVIDEVGITSGNPLVSAFIGPIGSRLAPWNGRRIETASYDFAGARLTSAELTVDSAVRLHVKAG